MVRSIPDDDFAMRWEVDAKAAKRLSDIGGAVKNADRVILATDPDREGEAISWHIHEILKSKKLLKDKRVDRVVFNAVTKDAVQEAMRNPREIDEALVDAYRARRALDYLVGFNLSPVLWRKLPGARSAGRVQSVALRIVCDRELEIEKFVAARILVDRRPSEDGGERALHRAPGRRRRQEDQPARHRLGRGGGSLQDRARAGALLGRRDRIRSRSSATPIRRSPPRPCSRRRRASSALRRRAPCRSPSASMRASTSATARPASSPICAPTASISRPRRSPSARRVIAKDFGDNYVPSAPRKYTAKAKNAQEAHEAIRPTDMTKRPRDVARHLEPEQAKLYELIWTRTIACQMESAELERTTVDILAEAGARKLEFRATGQVVRFAGFLALYQEGRDDEEDEEFEPPARDAPRREARQGQDRREPAFHRAAAPLHRGDAGQADGGARHRPPFDLRLDHRGPQGSRLRADREEAPVSGGQGPDRDRLPRIVLRQIRRLRFHRRSGREARPGVEQRDRLEGAPARLLERLLRRDRRHQGPRHPASARLLKRASGPTYFSRPRRRRRSAPLSALRRRAIVAETRQIRRLHWLLALSRMQVFARSGALGRGGFRRRPARRARAWTGSFDRRRDHSAQRTLRRLRAAGGGRQAQALIASAAA